MDPDLEKPFDYTLAAKDPKLGKQKNTINFFCLNFFVCELQDHHRNGVPTDKLRETNAATIRSNISKTNFKRLLKQSHSAKGHLNIPHSAHNTPLERPLGIGHDLEHTHPASIWPQIRAPSRAIRALSGPISCPWYQVSAVAGTHSRPQIRSPGCGRNSCIDF